MYRNKICPTCNTEYPDDVKFCLEDGSRTVDKNPRAQAPNIEPYVDLDDEALRRKVASLERELQEMKARLEALEAGRRTQEQRPQLLSLQNIPRRERPPSENIQRIEVVLDPKDPAKGYLVIEVKGVPRTDMSCMELCMELERLDPNNEDARKNILFSAKFVCSQTIAGLDTSYLRDKLPFYKTEKTSWGQFSPDSFFLEWLEGASLSMEVAKQILRIFNGQPALTKEEQWQ